MHVPVLLHEAAERLVHRPDGVYVDCTFGGGGHSRAVLGLLGAEGRLLALDWDAEAQERTEALSDRRFRFVRASFATLGEVLDAEGIGTVDGVLLDLGLSSFQLAHAARGFSFASDGPLDMRMDSRLSRTAANVVNSIPEKEFADLLASLGEVRQSRRLARKLVARRKDRKFSSTLDLADAVCSVVPRTGRLHPATKVFQALRIFVNDELGNLRAGLAVAAERVAGGGRLVVISFHSLEDRVVKNFMRGGGGQSAPFRREGDLIRPSGEETRRNPRARSARMRVGVRVAAAS